MALRATEGSCRARVSVAVRDSIYYWQTSKDKTYMLLAYAKARKENLEPEQVAILKSLVKELERHG